ncbi:hypothetical protein BCR34DRAFT_96544 [Clohesyomyces aquaticus]|uniref:Uncharacterized protein n=1 Tax=Clohesyomyces aquaticus TaxID=1231657 RepID=A0A1Y2A2B6_9PLEO|nr:hypothetical protein BCR34DRAFT_96544 [Clohesyomyces aquaticus]
MSSSTTTSHALLVLRQTASAPPSSTSYQACTWFGHCLGATCKTNDDCDNDWICEDSKCSPCCGDSSQTSTARASASASATAGSSSHHGLSTTTAIAPANNVPRSELDVGSSYTDDRKRLVGNESPAELAVSPAKPTELQAIELVELEGDAGRGASQSNDMYKPPLTIPPPTRAEPRQRSPHYRFEEYQVSPPAHAPDQLTFSPVSDRSLGSTYRPYQTQDTLTEERPVVGRERSENAYTLFRWPNTNSTDSGR